MQIVRMESDNAMEIHSESPDGIRGCSLYLGLMCMCQANKYQVYYEKVLNMQLTVPHICAVVTPLCACVSSGVGADHVVRVHKKQQGLMKHGRSVKIDFVRLSLF